jgi:hypothetical protein
MALSLAGKASEIFLCRYRTWFVGLWLPRIGSSATELKYKGAVWGLTTAASIPVMMLLSALFAEVFRMPEMMLLIVPGWLAFVAYGRHRVSGFEKLAQKAAEEYLPFKLKSGHVPLTSTAVFDGWMQRVHPLGNTNSG